MGNDFIRAQSPPSHDFMPRARVRGVKPVMKPQVFTLSECPPHWMDTKE